MDIDLTEIIIGVVAAVISAGFGLLAKHKGDKLATTKELISEVSDALADNKISKEEMQKIFDVIKKF